ncbi:MAG: sugar phosphate isomerase/epimerase family protein [Candidatus Latescibacteria bacterium]|jgi:hexulose-6-phosphate isomerase|nr:sugar phosphate isomerase/epimerase family protein [Candidatus Latescibacterota bacterium]
MKKGIVIRAFSGNPDFLGDAGFLNGADDFSRCFDRALEAGFEAVQLFVEAKGYFSLASDSKVCEEVAKRAERAGVALASLEIEPLSYLFTDPKPEVREHAEKTVCRGLEIAATMGLPGVLVIPGYVGLPWDPSATPVPYEDAYNRTRDGLKAVAPVAERLKVHAMVEPIWNRFLLSPMEMRGLIDEVGSEYVNVLFDTGNVVLFGYPEQWIRILGPRVKEVHLKDFRTAVGTIDGFVQLLEGDVNWPEVMTALTEIGFDGFITAELFPYAQHGDVVLSHTSASMDAILGREEP